MLCDLKKVFFSLHKASDSPLWYGNDLPLSSFPAPRNKNPSNISVVFHRGKDLIGIQVKTDVEGLLVEELRVEGLLVEELRVEGL